MGSESWAAASKVSASGASEAGVVFIVPLLDMFFLFPFENNSVSSFIPNDRKWESGDMAEAETSAVAAAKLQRLRCIYFRG